LSNTWYECPYFSISSDSRFIFTSNNGQLLRIENPMGARKLIAFNAKIKLDVNQPVPPKKYIPLQPGLSREVRSVINPRLSPDGSLLVFGAAGHIWIQDLDGNGIQRITEDGEFSEEAVFSPDGLKLAYVQAEYKRISDPIPTKQDTIRIYDIQKKQTSTVGKVGDALGPPCWRPNGDELVIADWETDCILSFNLQGEKKKVLVEYNSREPRPHFTADGNSLYLMNQENGERTLCQLELKENAKIEPIAELADHLRSGLVSRDEKWVAFGSRTEIWVSALDTRQFSGENLRLFSLDGGENFAFTPNGKAVIYATGNRVWIHNLDSGERSEVPIRLNLKRPLQKPMLLKKVRVFDFDKGGFTQETSLFIDKDRVRWIGFDSEHNLPVETIVLDTGGRFAIPGLFDMHIHGGSQDTYLAYGITSVRNVGAWLAWQNCLADRSDATGDALPRCFYSGDTFYGIKHPYYHFGDIWINNEDDARIQVRRWKKGGANFIKAYYWNPWKVHRALAEEARHQGLPVVGHGLGVEELTKSVTMGYASLEHSHYCYEDVFRMLKMAGTWWTPTLVAAGGNDQLFREEPERLAEEKLRSFFSEDRIRRGWGGNPYRFISDNASYGRWARIHDCIRRAHEVGVKLLIGTDSPVGELFTGISLHWELESLVQAGLRPLNVLQIATQQAAEAVGAGDDLGTLEPGKLADIILLDKNPLDDIKNTQSIWRVIKGGWVFDPEKLEPGKNGK
jgi:imidazolonepropionase-like amidohydrolase